MPKLYYSTKDAAVTYIQNNIHTTNHTPILVMVYTKISQLKRQVFLLEMYQDVIDRVVAHAGPWPAVHLTRSSLGASARSPRVLS